MMSQALKIAKTNLITATMIVGVTCSFPEPTMLKNPVFKKSEYQYTDETPITTGLHESPKIKAIENIKQLMSKFLNTPSNLLPLIAKSEQWSQFSKAVWELSQRIDHKEIDNINIKMSVENELTIYKHGKNGIHFLVIGEEANDISYVFTSNKAGEYTTMHLGKDHNLRSIVKKFATA